MSSYYALISSLPMLKFGDSPSISSETFLSYCITQLPPEEYEALESATLAPAELPDPDCASALCKYTEWEMSLRLAIAKIRANKLAADTSDNPFFKLGIPFETDADRAAIAAYSTSNPLEREKILDLARWNKLGEFELENPFGYDTVCAYRLKLMILEKWEKRKTGIPSDNLDKAASAVQKDSNVSEQNETLKRENNI